MPKCSSIGCNNLTAPNTDKCFFCTYHHTIPGVPEKPLTGEQQVEPEYTGGSVSYYKVDIKDPISNPVPYVVECGDVIEALGMDFNEGNAFKAIWRKCAARTLNKAKAGYKDGLYDSEKVVYFGERMVIVEQRKQPQEQAGSPND